VAVPSAAPPVTRLHSRHGGGVRSPKRRRAARQHAPTASTAARSGSADKWGGGPPMAATNPARPTANAGARARCRRRQSRAVLCGTSASAAAERTPQPAATRASTAPITSTGSSRPTRQNAGSKA
jgi:hypothetical protein